MNVLWLVFQHHSGYGQGVNQEMLDARLAQLRAAREEREVRIRDLIANAKDTRPEVPFRTVTVVDRTDVVDLDELQ